MIDEKSISTLSREQLFDAEIFLSLFDLPPEERKRVETLLLFRASDLGVKKDFMSVMKSYTDEDQKLAAEYKRTLEKYRGLELDKKGKPLATIENFIRIFEKDKKFSGLKFNLLSSSPEQEIDGVKRPWTDNDDAETRRYVEREYGFHSERKCYDALSVVFTKNQYHPIRDIVDSIEWDGKSRIWEFLIKWMKCEDTPYTREVSRLIFAGGIHRLYNPAGEFISGVRLNKLITVANGTWFRKITIKMSVEDNETYFLFSDGSGKLIEYVKLVPGKYEKVIELQPRVLGQFKLEFFTETGTATVELDEIVLQGEWSQNKDGK